MDVKVFMFDKSRAKRIHDDLNALLQDFAERNGLEFQPSRARFSTYDFGKKVQFKVKSSAAQEANDSELRASFVSNARKFGYDASLFGKIVKIAGAEYRVVGVNTRSRKQPIKLERVSDKRDFKCNVLALRAIA
jgi:hypothetical protein